MASRRSPLKYSNSNQEEVADDAAHDRDEEEDENVQTFGRELPQLFNLIWKVMQHKIGSKRGQNWEQEKYTKWPISMT